MHESWLSFPAGIIIASVASTVGIGGGILWMPFLLIILRIPPEKAIVTSLMIQTAGMGSGSLAFWHKKQIDPKLLLVLLPVTIPGIALGAYLTRIVAPTHLELILGMLTLLTAVIFVSASQDYSDRGLMRVDTKKARQSIWIISVMAVASGMLSVSIGEWLVPYMRNRLSLRMNVAIATSVMTIFGTCILGSLLHLGMGGRADWTTLLWAVPGVIIGAQIGPQIAEKINERALKEVFVFLLTLIGIHLIYNSY
jgi:uncharacterized membrane protein YfcA